MTLSKQSLALLLKSKTLDLKKNQLTGDDLTILRNFVTIHHNRPLRVQSR